jgi:micrococcal nuclease
VEHGGPAQDPDRLDGDGDGQACDSLPRRGTTQPASPAPTSPAPTPAPAPLATTGGARILTVIDGDTVTAQLATGERVTVRLIGLDAPETHKPNTPVECGGRQATANMRRLALVGGRGRGVTLVTDSTQPRTDVFGRMLAYARVDSGRDLALEQIRAGWAGAHVYGAPFKRLRSFKAAARAAKRAKRGVWRACGGSFHRPV